MILTSMKKYFFLAFLPKGKGESGGKSKVGNFTGRGGGM